MTLKKETPIQNRITYLFMSLCCIVFCTHTLLNATQLDLTSIKQYDENTYQKSNIETAHNIRNISNLLSDKTHTMMQSITTKISKTYLPPQQSRWNAPILRGISYAPSYLINQSIASALSTMIHEVGHAEYGTYYGYKTDFGIGDSDTSLTALELFIKCLTSSERAYTILYGTPSLTPTEETLLIGSGINTNTNYGRSL